MKKKVVAMIPVKLNNERLPGKNTKILGDKPLCAYLFDTVLKTKNVDEIYVFCSNDSFREYVPEGIHFLKRPAELDQPQVKGLQIVDYFVNTVDADIYALMHVTQPFITAETIDAAVAEVVGGAYDSAIAAKEVKEYLWYKGEPVNYNPGDIARTQDLVPAYIESELFVFEKDVFVKHGRRIGFKPYIHGIDWKQAVSIDTPEDFEMARAVVAMEKSDLEG